MRRALPPLLALVLALVLLTGCEFSLERLAHGGALPPPPEDYTGLQDGFRYTKTTLTGQERYLYDQLLAGLQNQEETIGDLYPDTEMIQTAIDAIDRDYPELFWFSGTGQIETTLLAGKPLEAAYTPVYTMDQAQRQATQAQIDQWAADCFATIPQGASDYDKALGVFTYIIQHADYQVVDNNSIVNIMVGGAGPIPAGPAGGGHRLHHRPGPGGVPRLEPGLAGRHPLLDRHHLGRPCLHRRGRQPRAGL